MNQTSKRDTIIYWLTTGAVCAVMAFSAVNFNLKEPLGPMDDACNDSARSSVFERHRGLLFSIAYRMLGSVADAEDALQDAFIRWHRASETDVRSPKAFLVTIVSRLCISHLQSARVQRETYVGEWLPEPLVTEPGSDVSHIAQVDESVSMAVLLLLARLTPVDRAVFRPDD